VIPTGIPSTINGEPNREYYRAYYSLNRDNLLKNQKDYNRRNPGKSGRHKRVYVECKRCGSDVKRWTSNIKIWNGLCRKCSYDTPEAKAKLRKSGLATIEKYGGKLPWASQWGRDRPVLDSKGSNNGNWKGGINLLNNRIRSSDEYKNWRSAVYNRDNFTCQICGMRSRGNIVAHHKIPFVEIIKESKVSNFTDALECSAIWDVENGLTLCESCHKPLHMGNRVWQGNNYGIFSLNKMLAFHPE